MTHRLKWTFRGKLIALCLTVVILSVGAMLVVSFKQLQNFGRKAAYDSLAMEARLNARLIANPFEQMVQDAEALAMLPDLAALPTGSGGAGDQIAARLDAFLTANAPYEQVSIIDLATGGRPHTQVQRNGDTSHTLPPEVHQWLATDPTLARLTAGGPVFSFRPHVGTAVDTGDASVVRTLHLALPVTGTDGTLVAALVLTANYRRLLLTAAPEPSPGHRLRVINAEGDYLIFDDDGAPSPLFETASAELAALRGHHWNTSSTSPLDFQDDTVAYFHEIAIPADRDGVRLVVVASAPQAVLMAAANTALNDSLMVFGVLIAATLLLTWSVSHIFTAPLSYLVASIRSLRGRASPINLPSQTQDEIGQLSQAFVDLTNDVISRSSQMFAMFECAVDGILTVRPDGVILSANPAACEMFGYGPDDLIGKDLDMLIPPGSRSRHASFLSTNNFDRLRREMAPNRDVQGYCRDGRLFDVEVSISQVIADSGNAFIAIMRDVSSRKAAESKLAQTITDLEAAKSELERSNSELDTFAYVASHDLKAPLRVIRNAASWLEQDLAEYLDEDTRESMDLLQSRVERMEQLLTDLLTHSRIGKEAQVVELISGAALMEQITGLLSQPDGFTISYDDDLARAQLCVTPLRNVLLNLISNAIKHHHRKDGTVHIGFCEDAEHFTFSIRDDGPGIAPEYHRKIFQMFQTLRPRDEVEGSGMGLAMVEKTVNTVGGTISLTSAPGEGSCFCVTWPKPASGAPRISDKVA